MDSQTLIVAIETSGRLGSVALATAEALLATATFSGPMRHSVELFPTLDRLLRETGRPRQAISDVYISAGPGSFTGLRIAVSAAKAMVLADERRRIVAVNTLDVIAANAQGEGAFRSPLVASVLDAKRGQFFTAIYSRGPGTRLQKVIADDLRTPQALLSLCAGLEGPVALVGEGLQHHRERFESDRTWLADPSLWLPSAARVYTLGREMAQAGSFSDPMRLTPYYLRGAQVTVKRS